MGHCPFIRRGSGIWHVRGFAAPPRLGGVSRARITQIMNLRLLAPHIQEKLLFHERVHNTKDSIQLRDLQAVALETDWGGGGNSSNDQVHRWWVGRVVVGEADKQLVCQRISSGTTTTPTLHHYMTWVAPNLDPVYRGYKKRQIMEA